jgi:hypothetical protein
MVSPIHKELTERIRFSDLFWELYPDHYSGQGDSARCPFHEDRHNSFLVKDDHGLCLAGDGCRAPDSKTKRWDVVDLVRVYHGWSARDAIDWLRDKAGLPNPKKSRHPASVVTASYDYLDEMGNPIFQVRRIEVPGHPEEGKSFEQWRWDGADRRFRPGMTDKDKKQARRVLYRLPFLKDAQEIWFVEGEKDVATMVSLGFCATTSPGGAGKWKGLAKNYNIQAPLAGKRVFIVPDNDKDHRIGPAHAEAVAKTCSQISYSTRIVKIPDKYKDVTDLFFDVGATTAKQILIELQAASKDYKPSGTEEKEERETVFSVLWQIVNDQDADLWHDQFRDSWITFCDNGLKFNIKCHADRLTRWLQLAYFKRTGKGCGQESVRVVQNLLSATAENERGQRILSCRTAWSPDGAILIDRGTPDWTAFEVTKDGWKIADHRIPQFRRFPATLHFPDPVKNDATLFDMLDFLPLTDANTFILLCLWLVSTWVPNLPRPGVVLHGEHGAGKSWVTERCRMMVDPSAIPIMSLPENPGDLNLQLDHAMLPCWDNLKNLPIWASDQLCRTIYGASSSERKLYSNDEEVLYSYCRTFMCNGIDLVVKRPDLMDRCLLIPLHRIDDEVRKPIWELTQIWEERRPKILHAMLDSLSSAMGKLDSVCCENPIRLADWHRWALAIGDTLGVPTDLVNDIIRSNVNQQRTEAISASPVGSCVAVMMSEIPSWSGDGGALLRELERYAEDLGVIKDKVFPTTTTSLTKRLGEIGPALRENGIVVEKRKSTKGQRLWRIKRTDMEQVE